MIVNEDTLQGKGKKRSVGWFPASYVKLLAAGEEASSGAGTGAEESSGIDHHHSEKTWPSFN